MIHEIFTKKNIEILMFLSKESVHIRDIADILHISPGKVHSAVQLFKKYKLVTERKKKNLKIIELNNNSLLWKKIKQLLEMEVKK
ncbi:winged helix-turn-helix transcriptional regulator [Candidatus Woesearchaeota archaeon]|nr:winged helix-turn-helix transcriptional regulator [Candidatus Woesearchaeota archaeon]MBT5272058.1 winged helix-turn-helix transcriptional regulator [Candidatus Woesearchaeota archaeon]MBT6041808.1 winged helix-turn-helix transcriptional regulator [Candidatus Woesearchaeota archaeon]MBT6336817.1 winged helix-turn-helix transcriptional regulator [Candidatus Woesearchaeota archaeon]MBT7927648.1 winged helix-turn-helix transcriptional regulator [Candidatus Woesearchaeota archaeon]